MLKIGIAADHGGFELKKLITSNLDITNKYTIQDFGADALDNNDDYPDRILPLAEAVSAGTVDKGIAICGSGVGASIIANKLPGVRAALITETYSAHQGVEHDDMNVLCLGGRVIGSALVMEIINAFLGASYIGEGRFERRLQKLIQTEEKYLKK
ncbi:RpiB/LacA/LacB family sugar-phosphate isomerase [Fulvivirga sp. 2943]|uniref:RpiB/LacA/LacB family sugar-phosphate isomerase n=2 Tax=Fulvivirgaceae TaxID=2762286 RepID=A0A937F8U8_9BACT|nr:RpiB/LacA/LacB family sugar-phosphate isomerase [Fulvivirga sediminis]